MISKDSAEHYSWGDQCDGWHLVRTQGLSIIQEHMPPGAREVRHHHEKSRQFFFVLSGILTVEVDGVEETIREGQGLEIAPGVKHQAINSADTPVEFLVISQPTTRGDRIE